MERTAPREASTAMRSRLRFSTLVIVSQMLLIALCISWLVHMVTIATAGSVYFVENNNFILWGEIGLAAAITLFAIFIMIMQIKKLGERRGGDRRGGDRRA